MPGSLDRGDGNRILRAHFGRSQQTGADVEEILAQGRPIRFGGQIADAIQMVLVGEAGKKAAPSRGRPCATSCCKRPGRRPVKAIVDRGEKCSGVNWSSVAPYTGTDDEERPRERPAEGLDDAEFVSSATTRAGYAPWPSLIPIRTSSRALSSTARRRSPSSRSTRSRATSCPGFGSFVQTLLGIRSADADSARRWLSDVFPRSRPCARSTMRATVAVTRRAGGAAPGEPGLDERRRERRGAEALRAPDGRDPGRRVPARPVRSGFARARRSTRPGP